MIVGHFAQRVNRFVNSVHKSTVRTVAGGGLAAPEDDTPSPLLSLLRKIPPVVRSS